MSRRKGEVKGREGAMLAQIPLVCSNSTEDVQHLKGSLILSVGSYYWRQTAVYYVSKDR